nr:MAG TPA_asm: antitoxin [Caudoviricetes sp.]
MELVKMTQFPMLTKQMTESPLFKRAQEMAYGKSDEEMKQIARNICAQKGVNFDEALKEFNKMFPK